MASDELGMQDDVAVDLHQVLAPRLRDGLVADGGQAKPRVLMPDVHDRHREVLRLAFDEAPRVVATAVVGDHDLERWHALRPDAREHAGQCLRPVVRRDQEGDRGGVALRRRHGAHFACLVRFARLMSAIAC